MKIEELLGLPDKLWMGLKGYRLVESGIDKDLFYEFWESRTKFEERAYNNRTLLGKVNERKFEVPINFGNIPTCDPRHFEEYFKTRDYREYLKHKRIIQQSQAQNQAATQA